MTHPFFPLLFLVATTASTASNSANPLSYPSVDAGLGEHLYPEEKPIADELSVMIEESIRRQYSAGSARRDAHPKAHGCVKAEISYPRHAAGGARKGNVCSRHNVSGVDSLFERLG
jgi:hypothetical protein